MVSWSLAILSCFFPVFVLFAFSFLRILLIHLLAQSFSSAMSSLLISLSKIFFSILVFFTTGISFQFFPRASIFLFTLSIWSCMLSTSHNRVLNILIMVDSNSRSDNPNIPAMSSSDAFSVSSNCGGLFCLFFWLFGISYNFFLTNFFFLILGYVVLDKRNICGL